MVKIKSNYDEYLCPEEAIVMKRLENSLGQPIPYYDDEFGYVAKNKRVVELRLVDLGLDSFLNEICQLTEITYLDLRENKIDSLPIDFSNLTKLEDLTLNVNNLGLFPDPLFELESLQFLYIQENQIKELPDKFENLSGLIRLDLSSNEISTIPKSFSALKKLETLFLNENHLKEFPRPLLELENLDWLTFDENDFAEGETFGDYEGKKDIFRLFASLVICINCDTVCSNKEAFCYNCGKKLPTPK